MAEDKELETKKPVFSETKHLSKQEREYFKFFNRRITELQEARTQEQYGVEIEKIWADADKDYVPHRLKTKGRRVIATDEEKGWRGSLVTLGASDWQSDISQPNPFVKIQIALSILVDRNPSGVFTAGAKKFKATTEIIRQLYQRSWEISGGKQQLKLFIFNLAKYGWALARTYPMKKTNKVRALKEYNEEDPEASVWEEKEVVEYNDIFRENIDPWNAWLDDMAKPNNRFSVRDWAWRKVYALDAAEQEFGKYDRWKYVQPGGTVTEKVTGSQGLEKRYKEKDLLEVYFYENRLKDLFMVVAGGVPIVIEPLPVSDAKGNKKLSCWQAYWNLRHAEIIYGIGIYEAIRNDQNLLDRIRNMTIDQLTMSIYKMFFFQGTQALTETGDIKISPGIGKQVLDPKNINWLNVPGPGQEAWAGLEAFRKDLDEASGITDPLMGVVTGKTAFEIAQAKEAALKRLKSPLDNITDALDEEGYITVSLIQLVYSIPETHAILDPDLIDAYLNEIESDPELYERDEETGEFTAKVFPEFPLNLEEDEKGNLIETQETRFLRIKPKHLRWEGIINIKSQSILTPSKQLDKALELEMYNMLIPLLAQPPQIYGKIAKNIVKLYDKDPKEILPDEWLVEPGATEQSLFMPVGQLQGQTGQLPPGQLPVKPPATEAETLTSSPTLPQQPQGLAQRIISKLSAPFRRI